MVFIKVANWKELTLSKCTYSVLVPSENDIISKYN